MNSLKDKRVFIVEDNVGNRAIMQTLLEQHNCKVFFERWGTNSVAKLGEAFPIDVILLDLMFPHGVTGYDVFEAIRSVPRFDNIPIVAVSASEPAIAIPKTREMGFAGFISKPVDFDMFPKQISRILDGDTFWDVN